MTGARTPPDWPTVDLVAHRVRTTPDRTAVVDADTEETWTYRELDRRVDALAAGLLSETDLERGSDARVGVLLHTSPAFATLCFAAMRIGLSLVPLNVRETPTELESKVERTDPALLVCEPSTAGLAAELVAETETDLPIRSLESAGDGRVEEHDERQRGSKKEDVVHHVEPLVDPTATTREAPDSVTLDRSTTQFVLFTSGTSGEPKGVRLTVGNLVASATASAFRLGVSPADRWLCCLPMYHMGGLAPVIRSALYGTAVVVQREFDPEATARVVGEYDITGVSLVPTMLERLLEADWSPPESLRFVLLGGAPATEDLLERCDRAGVPAYPTYGMTETASQIATATPDVRTTAPGTVGQPLAFADVSIVDNDGARLESGHRGELVVDGPMVTPGYLEDARTEAAFGLHGLHTGDVGYRDENGFLWVVGRLDDRIVSGGENVDPSEVAAVLESQSGVRRAAVVGLPDEEWGERVAALLVPEDPSAPPTVERLLDHCTDDLAGFKRPKTVTVVEDETLPRTPSGTVDREAVRELIERNGRDVP
ncbi:acyl--CoA ligase [Halobacteria archaeon AArc-m2/3/4]|uniref:Acyl--CoA ligase n=1 Tax=Natronoglomus mannanivorans TaxID=2979990 RepID=A0ABT2Q8M2_9EURY|nr:acyl--CoA ligase [Halobacteria archaeon AArc-m2/3/4]